MRLYVENYPLKWSQYLSLAESVARNAVNAPTEYSPFDLNSGNYPFVPLALMHARGVSNHVEAMKTMVDYTKIALEKAQPTLFVTQDRAKIQVD